MAAPKCPICQGKLTKGQCLFCGYTIPDEEDLSTLYNCDPIDYQPQPEIRQPEIREITPEVQAEEIYPNRPEPKFKVRDNEGKTIRGTYAETTQQSGNNPYASDGNPNASNGNPYASNGNPYADNGNFKAYTEPKHNTNSPFASPSANNNGGDFSEFLQKYWWLLLLSFFVPIIGLIIFLNDKDGLKNHKYKWTIIVAMVAGFIIPP